MQDIKYLLSIKELLEESTKEQLAEIAYKKVDSERRRKAENITNEKKWAESIGAGLLLQLGLQEIHNKGENGTIPVFTVSQVLAKLGDPIEVAYEYGEKNKPYFRDLPWYFNISHSGEYVLCVLSKQEVGVDIQYKSSSYQERILHRFFTEKEKELWEYCATREEKEDFFYRLWTAKEALGKLTGEGIGKTISVNVTDSEETEGMRVVWEYYDSLPKYGISICKWKETKE